MNREELIEAFLAGDIGDIEFMELAMEIEMDFDEINNVLTEAREDF